MATKAEVLKAFMAMKPAGKNQVVVKKHDVAVTLEGQPDDYGLDALNDLVDASEKDTFKAVYTRKAKGDNKDDAPPDLSHLKEGDKEGIKGVLAILHS